MTDSSNILPGGWGKLPPEEREKSSPPSNGFYKESDPLYISEGLKKAYTEIQKDLNLSPEIIYYPSCGEDITASEVFSKSRIIYVDVAEQSVNKLKAGGLEAYHKSALDFVPDQEVGVLILLNPQIPNREGLKKVTQHVKSNGLIICNDYHGTASIVRSDTDFRLIRVINHQGQIDVDHKNFADYFERVSNDQEYARADKEAFEKAKKVIEEIRGDTNNILKSYLTFLQDASEPIMGSVSKNDKTYDLPPRKKPNGYLFVFQRINQN